MFNQISERARALEFSKIREIAEYGLKLENALPLWFGEGSWPTNPLIVEAAVSSLRAGNHMYQANNGAMSLRREICRYTNTLYGMGLEPERVTVTPSGMQALMLVAQCLVTPGDQIVVLEPGWPNMAAAFTSVGARVSGVTLKPKNGKWALDLDKLLAALTSDVKAVVINSPHNPTGWTMSAQEQNTVLEHCRKHGIWIVSDDVYARLYRHGPVAPSFLPLATEDDLLISVNSFSKCWSMTGWRLGWIVAPSALEAKFGQLTEFNTSCTPGFLQDAGIVALRDGEPEIESLLNKVKIGYDMTVMELSRYGGVQFMEPDGAFYCFFAIDGLNNSEEAARKILDETGVGLAPGVAFGASGEGYLRLCYAQPPEVLEQAFSRLSSFLAG